MSARPSFFPGAASVANEPPATPAAREIEHIAERLGFVERAPPQVLQKRRKTVEEATHSFTARVSVRSANEFIAWCEREHLSYRQGFDHLMLLLAKHPDEPIKRT
jgi:hypothetical protein